MILPRVPELGQKKHFTVFDCGSSAKPGWVKVGQRVAKRYACHGGKRIPVTEGGIIREVLIWVPTPPKIPIWQSTVLDPHLTLAAFLGCRIASVLRHECTPSSTRLRMPGSVPFRDRPAGSWVHRLHLAPLPAETAARIRFRLRTEGIDALTVIVWFARSRITLGVLISQKAGLPN